MTTQGDIHRIVVGMDLTASGDHALREALHLGRLIKGTELHVVHVITTAPGLHNAKRLEQLSSELHTRMQQLGLRVTSVRNHAGDDALSTENIVLYIRLGEPAEALHQVAVDVDADMIVVSSHGRSGVERVILGSVAETLMRTARVPVCVAHPKDFSDLRHSDHPEPPRADGELHHLGLSERMHTHFGPRSWHISGLL